MLRRLWFQLSASFLLVALVAVGLVALLVVRAVNTSFQGYIGRESSSRNAASLIESLEAHYVGTGSWEGAQALLPVTPGSDERGGQGSGAGARFLVVDDDRIVVAASESARIGERLSTTTLTSAYRLYRGDSPVGWLVLDSPGRQVLNQAQADFQNEVYTDMGWAVGIAAVSALLIGMSLGLLVTRPLHAMTQAARAVAAGDLRAEVRVPAFAPAELETLARTFNRMSTALAEAEAVRQRMSSDIAHELRTPISVMRGQLQAMLDGVLPLDVEHIAIVYDHTLHLIRLVDDLRLLTQAEAGRLSLQLQPVQPDHLIARAVQLFEPLAQDTGVTLAHHFDAELPAITADADRLQQVFANLLANALRHVPAEGTICLEASLNDGGVLFVVANSGQTLSPDQAEHVFERFWRADEARDRDSGGAGLGLAIAQQIIRLHQGQIWVETTADETRFCVRLPAHSKT